MILISMALVLVGAVTLVVGFLNESRPGFIYTTIGASLLAAVFLLLGIFRQRPAHTRPALASSPGGAGGAGGPRGSWGSRSWNTGGGVATLDRDDATFGGVEIAYDDDPTDAAQELAGVADTADRARGTRVKEVQQDDWWAPGPDEPVQAAQDLRWDDADGDDADGVDDDEFTGEHVRAESWEAEPEPAPVHSPWEAMETGRWDPRDLELAPDLIEAETSSGEFAGPRVMVQTPVGAAVSAGDRETERFLEALRPVRGVGPSKQSELLAHFRTLRRLRNASVDRIAEVPGISTTLAQRIHSQLHP